MEYVEQGNYPRKRFRQLTGAGIILVVMGIIVLILLFSSVVYIGGTEVGIEEKKIFGGQLPEGRVIAVNGENGIQAQLLAPGWHFWKFPWQYSIDQERMTEIKEESIGLLTAMDGKSLPPDTVYAPEWENPDMMLDAAYFLTEGKGNGYKGPQLTVLKPGKYRLNTKLFNVTPAQVTNVKVGTVAVIKSNVGQVVKSEDRLVPRGSRGIWDVPLGEGKYYLHTEAYEVTLISIRQVKVSYTSQMESGERGKDQPLKPIVVRSTDGFTFPVDVRITYQIEPQNAPKVVAMIGDDELILDKLVTPRVRATFRNNGGKVKALDYVQNRQEQEQQSLAMLKEDLAKYGVTVLEISIGDVGDEESLGALLKTQTDREIALQEQETFAEQQRAAEKKKELTKTEQEAEEEKLLATAEYGVKVAEQEKKRMIIDAEAEAEKVKLVAEAQAQAYRLVSEVIGPGNAALVEIMKLVASDNIQITPDVMVGGSGAGGMTDALMGTILKGMLDDKGGLKTQEK